MPKRVSLKGKGAALFFGDFPAAAEANSGPPADQSHDDGSFATATDTDASPPAAPLVQPEPSEERPAPLPQGDAPRRRRSSGAQADTRASEHASVLASIEASTVEAIRKVIKSPGREVSFVRLTPEEKADLSNIVYTYKRQGQKTSETEINRIAINYLLLDFHEHGEQSVLARVLAALRA